MRLKQKSRRLLKCKLMVQSSGRLVSYSIINLDITVSDNNHKIKICEDHA